MIKSITYNDLQSIKKEAKKDGITYLKECSFLGFYIQNKLIGTVGWTKEKNKYVLRNDFVLSEYRGQSIYEKLHRERLKLLQDARVVLEIRCTKMSYKLHKRLGAVPIKSYKNYLHLNYYL